MLGVDSLVLKAGKDNNQSNKAEAFPATFTFGGVSVLKEDGRIHDVIGTRLVPLESSYFAHSLA